MKCQILFSGKNKKNISKCRLLKILPRVLSVKVKDRDHVYLGLQDIYSGTYDWHFHASFQAIPK